MASEKGNRRRHHKTGIVSQPVSVRHIAARIAPRLAGDLPMGYPAFLEDLKARIRTAQVKAALSVNRELIQLYWDIGRGIVERQDREGWGAAVIDRLAKDIRKAFPGIGGFSPSNISRMRSFYLAWAQSGESSAQAVPKSRGSIPAQAVPKSKTRSSAQPVPKSPAPLPPPAVTEIPWGHNVVLLFQVHAPRQRLWYARQTVAHGWSRSLLLHWIESDLYARQGKAITNFSSALPAPQSDLARELIKDPYNFDFLTLRQDASEREVEEALLEHLRKFLLELGAGFAFVGQQVPIEVDGEIYSMDLLFYHLRLRCYVVIDLKVVPFKPDFAGRMNFYLSAVDDQMRHPEDRSSIGLILCKSRGRTVAEYALRDLAKPVGIAKYDTKLREALPTDLAGALPTVQQLRAEMNGHQPATCKHRSLGPRRSRPHRPRDAHGNKRG